MGDARRGFAGAVRNALQAQAIARDGLRAFVVSGNLGVHDSGARYGLPPKEITGHIRRFIEGVRGS